MKVAINTRPLHSAHKARGIGYYTAHLLKNLKEDSSIQVEEFTNLSEVKEADVIHYPWFDLFFHTLPISRSFPTVVTIHDVIPLLFPKHHPVGIRGKINFFLQKLALNTCNFIITDSNASKKDIEKYLKIDSQKISVIYLAQDQKFTPLFDAKLIHTKRKYRLADQFLLYVGDANWVKNLPFLIEGFRQIITKAGLEEVKLVLVGGVFLKKVENINHPELKSLKFVNRLVKDYGLDDKVVRVGQISDEELVAFYNLASLYVQPSFYEGFGLPILEAMACGTPVVCSNNGSLSEIGGDAALYFDPRNLGQFKHIILEILQNKSLSQKLSALGLKQADKFSWKKVAEEVKKVYSNVTKS